MTKTACESPDEIVLAKDLKPGDCVRTKALSDEYENDGAMGIVTATTFVLDDEGKKLKRVCGDNDAVSQYDINCPSDGPFFRQVDPDKEYTVIRSRKDILYTYETIEHRLLTRSADLMRHRNKLMGIKFDAIDRMNDRLKDELKEKLP